MIDGPETARLQRANGSQGSAEVKSLRLCTHRCEISSRGRSETELPWILTAGASGVLLAEGTLPAEPPLRVTCIHQNDIHRNMMLRKNCSHAFAPRGTRSRSCCTVNWCHRYKYGTLEVLRTRNSFSSECFSRSRFCTGRKPSRTGPHRTKPNRIFKAQRLLSHPCHWASHHLTSPASSGQSACLIQSCCEPA